MWARVVEAMLGCWLALSPFIFRHSPDATPLWVNDLGVALVIVTLALLSYWEPMRYAHLGLIGVGVWLIGFGYLGAPYPTPPALQNHIALGLLLLMLAIIPNEASLPPRSWRKLFLQKQKASSGHGICES